MTSIYSVGLFNFEILTYIISGFIVFRTYRQTKYPAHLILTIAFGSLLLHASTRFTISFFSSNPLILELTKFKINNQIVSIGLINILWTLSIIFLILGILFFITSFVYARLNSLHPIINIASFLSGALILIFSIPFFTTIEHDVQFGVWYASYDILVTIIIVPLLLFVIIVLVLPIIRKLRLAHDKKMRRQLFVQALGLLVVITWAFLTGFTSISLISLIRPFILPLGWLIWSVTLYLDPFNIMASDAKVTQLLISTEVGLPVYYNDFTGPEDISFTLDSGLASGLISGVTQALESIIQDKSQLTTLAYEDTVIGITIVGFLRAYVFGERFDKTLETVLNVLLRDIQNSPELSQQIKNDFIDLQPETGKNLNIMIATSLRKVLVI